MNFGLRRSLPPPGRVEAEASALSRRVYLLIRCVSVDGPPHAPKV
ncbi:MAG: hypothetical protein Q8Q12_01985 [bacterium]|nr:hypothetical protein [bacterium]